MYCSHRDAAILSFYSHELNNALEAVYFRERLGDQVIAYRKLGKANYHFAKEVFDFVRLRSPCTMMCFDISGFFNNLDWKILKSALKEILGVESLSEDWQTIYRVLTRYHYVNLDDLKATPALKEKIENGNSGQIICTIKELKKLGITISPNKEGCGIPQGTPISASFSNAYMINFDRAMRDLAISYHGFYRRYSDDFVFVCATGDARRVEQSIQKLVQNVKLELAGDKTECVEFGNGSYSQIQYLGFGFDGQDIFLRPSSLSRQWRKLRRKVRHIKRIGQDQIAKGKAKKIYTKTLYKKFTAAGNQNFPSYGRRAASVLGAKKILDQINRLERELHAEIRKF